MAELLICNQRVGGSIPSSGSLNRMLPCPTSGQEKASGNVARRITHPDTKGPAMGGAGLWHKAWG